MLFRSIEANVLMLSANNILSPSNGQPLAIPTQDVVLGCYYLTKARLHSKGEGRAFASTEEVLLALEAGEVETLTPIRMRLSGPVIDLTKAFDDQDIIHTQPVTFQNQMLETTVGRVILNDHLPPEIKMGDDMWRLEALEPSSRLGQGFGLGFTVRNDQGRNPLHGSPNDYHWAGAWGTYFWHDPREHLYVVLMMQSPSSGFQYRHLMRGLVYQALIGN